MTKLTTPANCCRICEETLPPEDVGRAILCATCAELFLEGGAW